MDATLQKEDLRKLLHSRAPDSSLKNVARALLGAYIDIAEACSWPLADASSLNAADLAKRLTLLLGVPVNDIRFVSLAQPYSDTQWATPEGFTALFETGLSAGLERSLDRDFCGTYWGRLQLSMERRLLKGLGEERLDFLERDVKTKLMCGLRQALYATLAGPMSVQQVEECATCVEDTLRDFLAITVLDDRTDGVPLGHMVRLMTQALPLGAKRGDPGTWIVLAA